MAAATEIERENPPQPIIITSIDIGPGLWENLRPRGCRQAPLWTPVTVNEPRG